MAVWQTRPPKKLSKEQYTFIDNAMVENDELTARQLRDLVEDQWRDESFIVDIQTYKERFKAFSHLILFECELNSHSPDAHGLQKSSI